MPVSNTTPEALDRIYAFLDDEATEPAFARFLSRAGDWREGSVKGQWKA